MNFEVTIKDQRGEILYYKKTGGPATNYKSVFDFSELKEGNYSLNIACENCNIQREIVLEKGKLEIGNEVRLYNPWVRVDGDKVYVSILNPALKNVYLNVYEDGQQVTRKKLGKE